jgi:hypothetical protein
VPVSAGDRVALGTLSLELGALAETVTVSSEAPLIQAQSGDRSYAVGTTQIANLPMSNRSCTAIVALEYDISDRRRSSFWNRMSRTPRNKLELLFCRDRPRCKTVGQT